MLGGLLFIVCVVLQFHYHDSLPWYIWVVAVIALCVSFGEPAMRNDYVWGALLLWRYGGAGELGN